MAVDTAAKRCSAIHVTAPWRMLIVPPDGTVDVGARQAVAFLYSGIAASEAVVVPETPAGIKPAGAPSPARRRPRQVIISERLYRVRDDRELADLLATEAQAVEESGVIEVATLPEVTKRTTLGAKARATGEIPTTDVGSVYPYTPLEWLYGANVRAQILADLPRLDSAVVAALQRQAEERTAAALRADEDEAIAILMSGL